MISYISDTTGMMFGKVIQIEQIKENVILLWVNVSEDRRKFDVKDVLVNQEQASRVIRTHCQVGDMITVLFKYKKNGSGEPEGRYSLKFAISSEKKLSAVPNPQPTQPQQQAQKTSNTPKPRPKNKELVPVVKHPETDIDIASKSVSEGKAPVIPLKQEKKETPAVEEPREFTAPANPPAKPPVLSDDPLETMTANPPATPPRLGGEDEEDDALEQYA